jgi:predicted PurR-regulated permease PerM
MKSSLHSINPKIILATVGFSVIILLLFLRDYFILIAIAAILAYLFNPVYKWSLKKFNKIGIAISITIFVLFATVTIPLAIILAITATQALELLDNLSNISASSGSYTEFLNQVISGINEQINKVPLVEGINLSTDQVIGWIKEGAASILSTTLHFATSLAGGVASFFTQLIIFLFVFISLLKNQQVFTKTINELNPLGDKMSALYFNKMGAMTTAMVKGQFIIAIAQGLSGVFSLWIVGMDYLAFWFVLLTFLSIIPLGGGIILIPFGIILILTGNVWGGAFILGWHFIVTTNIDNILRPKFVPKSARLDPALTILSVFAGIGLFGFVGIVLGPVIMIMIVTTIKTYIDYKSEIEAENFSKVAKSTK